MSKYTTEVRFICETANGLTDSNGYNDINSIINNAIPKVFDFSFPIFDENYRNVLCGKILKHYYTREISEETVGLWKLRLNTKMNEIMPFYNQLYKSELYTFNPFYDVDLTTKHDGKKTQNEEKTETGNKEVTSERNINSETSKNATGETTTGRDTTTTDDGTTVNTIQGTTGETGSVGVTDLYSDTPQGSLQNVENQTYLTNARKTNTTSKTDTANNVTENGTSKNTNTVTDNINVDTKNNESVSNDSKDGYEETSNNTVNGNSKINSTEDYILTVQGKNGGKSYSAMLKEFRETFLNIDMMIINDLSPLFFGLW